MDVVDECPQVATVSDSSSISKDAGLLCCWLPADHDGPHYDEHDDLTWQKGKPDGVQ